MKGRYFIKLNGSRLPEEIEAANTYFEFESSEELLDRLILRFKSSEGSLVDTYFQQGDEVEFTFGQDEEAMSDPRTFTVRRVEGVHMVTVTAYEPAHAFVNSSRSKVYRNITLDELAGQKARENGLQFAGDSFPLRYKQLAQVNESDMRFLQRAARRQNAVITFDRQKRTLYLEKRGTQRTPVASFVIDLNGGYDRGKAIEFQPLETNLGIPWEVSMAGMDPLTLQAFEMKAGNSTAKRTVLGADTIVYDGAGGSQARPGQTGIRKYTAARSSLQAKEEAAAMYEMQEARQVGATVTLWGNPDVTANRIIRLTGDIERWAGLYRATKTRHIIESSYKIRATLTRNAAGTTAGGRATGGTALK